jgi:hypothetical protein
MTAAGAKTVKLPSTGISPKMGTFLVGAFAVEGSILVRLQEDKEKVRQYMTRETSIRRTIQFLTMPLVDPMVSVELLQVAVESQQGSRIVVFLVRLLQKKR